MKKQIALYWDPISPYVWLALRDLGRLQAAGLEIICRPVLFAGLLNEHGQKGPAEIPAKRAYTFADVLRQAERRGLSFQGPPSHPFNPLRALRMTSAIADDAQRLEFACALSIACWERGADLSQASVLDEIAADCSLASLELGKQAESAAVKEQLLQATKDAIALGVFGVPSMLLDGEIFWGCDRFDDLLWRLEHPQRRELELLTFLQRGASAKR